jgi:hypothetical protein
MRSFLSTVLVWKAVREDGPEFVPDRVDVMPDSEGSASVSVAVNELIVHLQNEFVRIECDRAIGVHTKMHHGLIGEEIRLPVQHLQSLESPRPV